MARVVVAAAAAAAAAGWLLLRNRTVDSDDTGETAPPPPPASGGLGAAAVGRLQARLGERGLGKRGTAGYHRGSFVDAVNRGLHGDAGDKLLGEPWCARACRWAYEAAAADFGWPRPFAGLGDLASVSKFKKAFRGYELARPRVGAVLLLGDRHATLVAQVLGDREVVTVEGNHGDAVANVRRRVTAEDTLLDVERWVDERAGRRPALVAGAELEELG